MKGYVVKAYLPRKGKVVSFATGETREDYVTMMVIEEFIRSQQEVVEKLKKIVEYLEKGYELARLEIKEVEL